MKLEELVEGLPREEQRKLYLSLAKQFKVRESGKVPRETRVATSGRIMALMNGMNLSEMKKILNFTLAIVESAMDQWKYPGKDGISKDETPDEAT